MSSDQFTRDAGYRSHPRRSRCAITERSVELAAVACQARRLAPIDVWRPCSEFGFARRTAEIAGGRSAVWRASTATGSNTDRPAPGDGPPMHRHSWATWEVVIEGRMRAVVGDETYELGPGELLFTPPTCPTRSWRSATPRPRPSASTGPVDSTASTPRWRRCATPVHRRTSAPSPLRRPATTRRSSAHPSPNSKQPAAQTARPPAGPHARLTASTDGRQPEVHRRRMCAPDGPRRRSVRAGPGRHRTSWTALLIATRSSGRRARRCTGGVRTQHCGTDDLMPDARGRRRS